MMTVERDPCPPGDLLVEAASPAASRAVRERVADHLVSCAKCAEEFRLLQALGPWASEHAHLVAPAEGAASGPARAGWRFITSYAIAAVLAVIAVGLGVQVRRLERENQALAVRANAAPIAPVPAQRALDDRIAEQQRTIADLEGRLRAADAPDLNPPIIDLEAADASRAGARPAQPPVPAGARQVVFVLNTSHRSPGAAFEVELVDAAGRVVWDGSGLKQSADGTLTLVVPRALAGSASRIRLYSRAGDRRALVEQYVLPAH